MVTDTHDQAITMIFFREPRKKSTIAARATQRLQQWQPQPHILHVSRSTIGKPCRIDHEKIQPMVIRLDAANPRKILKARNTTRLHVLAIATEVYKVRERQDEGSMVAGRNWRKRTRTKPLVTLFRIPRVTETVCMVDVPIMIPRSHDYPTRWKAEYVQKLFDKVFG